MRILHVGRNDGSHICHTVKWLNERNLKAIGMTFYYSKIVDYAGLLTYKKYQAPLFYFRLLYELLLADFVHLWSKQVFGVVFLVKLLRKNFCIEWTGSDVRIPEYMPQPYHTDYNESKEIAAKNQKPFKNVLNIFSSPVLIHHGTNLYKKYIPHRIYYKDLPSNPTCHRPLKVSHAASARKAKGTHLVMKAVDGLPIQFVLIENTPHKECLSLVNDSDVVIGQMVWGENGMQELESMSMGKPTLCYINHKERTGVIECEPGEIRETLIKFLSQPSMVIPMGEQARKFIESSVGQAVDELIKIYQTTKSVHNYRAWIKQRYVDNPQNEFTDSYGWPDY